MGDKFQRTGWVNDYNHRLIGVVQLRQVLIIPDRCLPAMLRRLLPDLYCAQPLTRKNEDRHDYSLSWGPVSQGHNMGKNTMNPWKYSNSSVVKTLIDRGFSKRFYFDGGYILTLDRTTIGSQKVIWKMIEAHWFSRRAQAFFINVNVYSPSYNKISLIAACLEIRQTGGVDCLFRVLSIPVISRVLSWYSLIWVFIGGFNIFLILWVSVSIIQRGSSYFRSPWNTLDFFIVILFTLNFYFGLLNAFRNRFSIEDHLTTGQDEFFMFGWVGYHTDFYYILYAVLMLLCMLKLFKHCYRSLQVAPIVRTLSYAGNHIVKITIFVAPMIYIQSQVMDDLLFNARSPSDGRVALLVNKLALHSFCKLYTFPDNKFVPYLFCLMCSFVIFLFSVLLAYHYRIAKNNSLVFAKPDFFQKLGSKLNNSLLRRKVNLRLRGGADKYDDYSSDDESQVISSSSINKSKDMKEVLENTDMKLNRIVEKLMLFNKNLS